MPAESRSRVFFRLASVFTNRPAPTSSRNENATCAATSALRSRAEPPVPPAAVASVFERGPQIQAHRLQRGREPEQQPGEQCHRRIEAQNAQVRRRRQRERRDALGRKLEQRAHHGFRQEQARHARPPAASSRLSTSSWPSNWPREAPMASRTATSRCRATPRAISRFATLKQAITSTSPTMHISAISAVE